MSSQRRAWVAATLDTKIDEALYVCDMLDAAGLLVNLADLSTKGTSPSLPQRSTLLLTSAFEIAAHRPKGASAVFCAPGSILHGDIRHALADLRPERMTLCENIRRARFTVRNRG